MNENKSKSENQNSEQISLDNLSTLLNGSKEQMIRMTEVFLDQIEKHFNELKFALNGNMSILMFIMDNVRMIVAKNKLNKIGLLYMFSLCVFGGTEVPHPQLRSFLNHNLVRFLSNIRYKTI